MHKNAQHNRRHSAVREMTTDNKLLGQRFSHVYIPRGEPFSDSTRMRGRLASLLQAIENVDLYAFLKAELGIAIPWTYGPDWNAFIAKAELRDVLDIVTLVHGRLKAVDKYASPKRNESWLRQVRRIFKEEHVGYLVDDDGGVHFAIDAEFAGNQQAAIAALQTPRYANVLNALQAGFSSLDETPANGKAAIRGIFAAAEGLFRLTFVKAHKLGGDEIKRYLKPAIDAVFTGDETSRATTHGVVNSFLDWIVAAHNYRHEPGTQETAQPPLSLAVLMVSQGAAFVRWLAEVDAQLQTAQK